MNYEFLSSSIFRYGVFPLSSVVLGIAVKYVSKNDRYAKFRKEDISVGLDLIRTSCLMYMLVVSDKALELTTSNEKLSTALQETLINETQVTTLQGEISALSASLSKSGWSIALLFLVLWGTSTIVRKLGWKSETEMHNFYGITLPLIIGLISLYFIMNGA